MARKRDDAIPADAALAEAQVADYLRRHPDFLVRHSDLLLTLSPPSRFGEDDGVVDMQAFMIDRMRDEMARVKGAAEHLIRTSRSNLSTQDRTHRAALVLLAADSMEGLLQAVTDDLPALLDVDVATLRFEAAAWPPRALAAAKLPGLSAGTVERILGGVDRDVALAAEMPGEPSLFAEAADLVRSAAMARLAPGAPCPPGLLCLGSRDGRTFHAGQATDLLTFLAHVVEGCLRRLAI